MSKKVKAPKQHADTHCATEAEPANRTFPEEVLHLEYHLSCNWPSASGDLFKVVAFDAATASDNRKQRDWLIENHPLYSRLSHQCRETDADVWIALTGTIIALDEGRLVDAEQLFEKTNKLRAKLSTFDPLAETSRQTRSKGGHTVAVRQQPVMEYCAKLILGSGITKANLDSQVVLAMKLFPKVKNYIRDHRDELKGSQLDNHADKHVGNLIRRWLSKTQDNVARKAYEERRRQEGLPPR